MATYRVEVVRTGYRVAEIEVEANSIDEANALALEKAGDTMFSDEYDADYEVNSVDKNNIMYLAIGIETEQGFCASRATTSNNPQEVASYLNKEFHTWFDQILLVENGDSPSVINHWNIDRDYKDK